MNKDIRAEFVNRSNEFHSRAFSNLCGKIRGNIQQNELEADEARVRQYDMGEGLEENYRFR